MIERDNRKLSIRKQCELLDVNRNRLEPRAPKRTASDLETMRLIDGLHTEHPYLGARKIVLELRDLGRRVGRGRVRRLMRLMGIEALVPQPYTSKASPENPVYPYLLRGRAITRVPTRCGARTSPISRWRRGTPIWWRSWTGTHARCSPGN
jgi:putative transposase